jgi:predicted RecA/RadA family phage recombinase
MTQTAAVYYDRGWDVDYTPSSYVYAGDVVLVGTIPMVARGDIAANEKGSLATAGVFLVPKDASVFAAGDAVYWNASATDLGNNTGAASNSASGANLMGVTVIAANAAATTVETLLHAAKRTATIAGAVTATDITGSDSALSITGLAGAGVGGTVTIVGATGAATYAGGLVSMTGGAGNTTGDGNTASMVGGASGTGATGNGAAAIVTGGAALSVTGNGGPVTVAAGVATNSGTGGPVTVYSGASAAANGTAGALTIDTGAKTGGTAGALSIGATNAGVITIGGANSTSLTLGKNPRVPFASVAATGTVIGNAAAVVEGWTLVTGADNSAGIQLPTCVNGAKCMIINQNTVKTLKIYPPTAKQINGAGANNAITLVANGTAMFASEGANAYYGGLFAGIMS